MTLNQRNAWIAALLAAVTIVTGFAAWGSFVAVSFAASFWLTRRRNPRALLISIGSPVLGWLLMALARDLREGGRVSAKLATLLHVRFAPGVYVVLALIALIPCALAAQSGERLSKTFR